MKRYLIIIFLLFICFGCGTTIRTFSSQPPIQQKQLTPVMVTRVVDGDTVVVSISGKEENVRFIGINTPESTTRHEPYGSQASAYTKEILAGKKVFLEFDVSERDKYGRLLAYLWLEEPAFFDEKEIRSKMFNARLLSDGYAQIMTIPPDVKYADIFLKLEREARELKKGLWG